MPAGRRPGGARLPSARVAPGPRGERHVAVGVEVVRVRAVAGALEEDLAVPAGEHVGEVAVVGLALDLDARRAEPPRVAQGAHDVARLVLDEREVRRAVVAVRTE